MVFAGEALERFSVLRVRENASDVGEAVFGKFGAEPLTERISFKAVQART